MEWIEEGKDKYKLTYSVTDNFCYEFIMYLTGGGFWLASFYEIKNGASNLIGTTTEDILEIAKINCESWLKNKLKENDKT